MASSDGVDVAYLHLAGPGSGPRILYVHATGFCSTVWRPVAETLAAASSFPASSPLDGWALDVRGHGRSGSPADGRFDWNGTADDVLAVIDAIGEGERWIGAGHSMGGASLLLAEQRRPGTFSNLWLFEPIVFPGPPPEGAGPNFLAEGALRRRAAFGSREEAFENYASKPPMNAFDRRALAGYLERGLTDDADGVHLSCAPANEAQLYRMGPQHAAWGGLGAVRTPTTVVRGDASIPGPATFAADIAARLGAGRLEEHPDLGHFGPMEAPERMAASIRGSLSDTRSTITP
ncbi:MAG: alpha/beta hydrolase [Acidimicrobiales bacterium]